MNLNEGNENLISGKLISSSEKEILFLFAGYFLLGGGILILITNTQNNFLAHILRTNVLDFLPIVHTLKNSNVFDIDLANQLLTFLIFLSPAVLVIQLIYVDFTCLYAKKIKNRTVQKFVSLPLCFLICLGLYYTNWSERMMQKAFISSSIGFLFIASAYIFFFLLFAAFFVKTIISFFQDK